MANELDLVVRKGTDFNHVVRWESSPIRYVPIEYITNSAPVNVHCKYNHGIPNGWRVAVASVKGMTQLNTKNTPPKNSDYYEATVITPVSFQINTINSTDFGAYPYDAATNTYLSCGVVQYNTPVDLGGFEARMSIKDKVGGVEILRLDTTNLRITIDELAHTINLKIPAALSEIITAALGVYDLEMVGPTGVVTTLHYGTITFNEEITTT